MKNSIYRASAGCVVSYKPMYETLLFNELNIACNKIKLLERGIDSAAFTLEDYNELLEYQHSQGFIFLQHIHPYISMIEITGTLEDFSGFLEAVSCLAEYIEPREQVVAQCRIVSKKNIEYTNPDLTELFANALSEQGFLVEPQAAQIAVSLTVLDQHAFLGLSELKRNESSWTGGVRFFSREDSVICRAENKLEEAFQYFQIPAVTDLRALDLGAAPGGWTNFLCKQGCFVDAVDPAGLDPRVLEKKQVSYYPMTAQEFSRQYSGKEYDLIVNDMKMDTNESIDILCEMSKQLKPDGAAVLTLKLPKREMWKRIQVAKKVLGRQFEWVRMHQLYYNRSEVTVYLRKRKPKA